MRYSYTIVLFFLLSTSTLVQSQNYLLKVLANKGDNQVRKANGQWEKLRTGASLVSTDLLKVSKDAYIGFVHESGYALEWKKEGTFPVSEIESRVVATSSLVSKYADFLASKSNAENTGNIAGGVHRGSGESLFIFSPNSAMVLNEKVKVSWTENETSAYALRIKNLYGNMLVDTVLETNSYMLDLSSSVLKDEKTVLLQIIDRSDPTNTSQEIAVVKVDQNQREELLKNYNNLTQSLDHQSALGQYLVAGFYEDKKLFLEALNSYQTAIEMAPEVIEFKDGLNSFLKRSQLLRK